MTHKPEDVLTEEEFGQIHDEVFEAVKKVWSSKYAPLEYTYCSRCPDMLEPRMRQRCLCNMMTLEALCPACWAREREQELIKEAMERHMDKPSISDEESMKPKEPFPVAELKYGGLTPVETDWKPLMIAKHKIPLDLAEFCRL